MHLQITRTSAEHPDFVQLVDALDAELRSIYGDKQDFYDRYNKVANLKHVLVAYVGVIPVACGLIKPYTEHTMEIKRMYVVPHKRGKGFAHQILRALEAWAAELGCRKCILETGDRQMAAISLYERNGYRRIENYAQYSDDENSVCFEKEIQAEG